MIIINTSKCAKLGDFMIERGGNDIWVYQQDGYFSATDDDWREIIKQVSALLEPAKAEAAPDTRGYVFIDLDGDAWGWDATSTHRGPQWCADRPFKTRMEAEDAAKYCRYGCQRIEVWTPESRVPPMPEKQP